MKAFLDRIERVGNQLPHPTWLFVYLCLAIIGLSVVTAFFGVSAVNPISDESLAAKNLLSGDGIRWMLTHTVSNFTQFAPVGTVLVAMLGLGLAERSGLIGLWLRLLVSNTPKQALSFVVVFAGVMSSIAADAGYVVLIPLAALVFQSAGRSPLLGIAAAFAGVSAGYSANLVIGPVDVVLSGLSTEAIQIVNAGAAVSTTANYYFIVSSTVLISAVATWVTEKVIAPRFASVVAADSVVLEQEADIHRRALERKALIAVVGFSFVFVLLCLLLTLPEQALLRNPDTGSLVKSPFVSGIVVVISLYFGVAGYIFGRVSGSFATNAAAVEAMEASMKTMAGYLVLMFFAAQFVNYFAWTELGAILAINGAGVLQALALPSALTLVLFIVFIAFINLFVGSASAKWALLAPVFVPMLFLLGIDPASTQMAYRIGDSTTNIISPLMPYFGVVVAYVQVYRKEAGMGTLVSMMLPYSLALLVVWSLFFAVWIGFGLPLGR